MQLVNKELILTQICSLSFVMCFLQVRLQLYLFLSHIVCTSRCLSVFLFPLFRMYSLSLNLRNFIRPDLCLLFCSSNVSLQYAHSTSTDLGSGSNLSSSSFTFSSVTFHNSILSSGTQSMMVLFVIDWFSRYFIKRRLYRCKLT